MIAKINTLHKLETVSYSLILLYSIAGAYQFDTQMLSWAKNICIACLGLTYPRAGIAIEIDFVRFLQSNQHQRSGEDSLQGL